MAQKNGQARPGNTKPGPKKNPNEQAPPQTEATAPANMPTRAVIKRLGNYLKPNKRGWYLSIAAVLAATLATSTALRLIQPLLDNALPLGQNPATYDEGLALIRYYLFFMILLTIVGVLLIRQGRMLVARLAQHMLVGLRSDYYASLTRQHPGFFGTHDVGKLLSIGINDAEVVNVFFTQQVPYLMVNVGQLLLALFFMLQLSLRLTMWSIVSVGVLQLLSLYVIVPRMRRLALNYRQELARANSRLNENLSGIRDIQIFGQESRTIGEFYQALNDMAKYMVRNMSLTLTNVSIFYLLSGLGIALIYGFGALNVIQGLFAVGFVVSFAAFFAQFVTPVTALSGAMVSIQSMIVAAARMFELMALEPLIQDKPDAIDPGPLAGHIKFENAGFSYDPGNQDSWRLQNVNLEIKPGEKVAFVGGSGTGKSTLLGLVGRFFDVTEGRVTIDGHDVRDLKLQTLRSNIGMVSQNVVLFQGTLADNIGFARPDASLRDIKAAAATGYVDEFVGQLERGYDTELGPMGQGLSGGQKQRVSIARMALANPSILMLDEATSALDNKSEAVVMRSLDKFSRKRTTLSIAHRLDTIINADKIVVMGTDIDGNGMIKAVGRHEELLETSEEYGLLYRHKLERRSILMPIGPLYDTTPILPTVIGLARSFVAPVHLLDFGPITTQDTLDNERFGIIYDSIQASVGDIQEVNRQHVERVDDVINLMRQEGVTCEIIQARPGDDWIDATLDAIFATQTTHMVAMENVLIPLEDLRGSIRLIERKTDIEYIMVDPFIIPTLAIPMPETQSAADWSKKETMMSRRRMIQRPLYSGIPAQQTKTPPAPIAQFSAIQSLLMFAWPAALFLLLFYAVYPLLTSGLGLPAPLSFLTVLTLGHGAELAVGLLLAALEGRPLTARLGLSWPKTQTQWLALSIVATLLVLLVMLIMPSETVFWSRLLAARPGWWPDFDTFPAWAIVVLAQLVGPLFIVLGEEVYYRGYLLPKMKNAFGRLDWIVNALLVVSRSVHQPWVAYTLSNLIGSLTFSYYGKQRQLWASIALHYLTYLILLLGLTGILA